MKLNLKNSYIILTITIICTIWLMNGWEAWVMHIIYEYHNAHPEYRPHKYMATLQLLICFISFIINLIIALLNFRSELWAWGVWLVLSTIFIAHPYFTVFGLASDIAGYYHWIDIPFIGLVVFQILNALLVRYFYLKK